MSAEVKERTVICRGSQPCKDLSMLVYQVWMKIFPLFTPEMFMHENTITIIVDDSIGNKTTYNKFIGILECECEKILGYVVDGVSRNFRIRFIPRLRVKKTHLIPIYRKHTNDEYIEYLKKQLRYLFAWHIIDSVNYRTHKGLLRRGHITRVENYIFNLFALNEQSVGSEKESMEKLETLISVNTGCTLFKNTVIVDHYNWNIPDDDVEMIITCKSILSVMAANVMKSCKRERFLFGNKDKNISNLRYPNRKELKNWLKAELRYLHFNNPKLVPIATYRTLCGQLKRYNFNRVFDFLRANQKGDIIRRFNDYKKSKIIMEFQFKYTPVELVPVCSFSVEVPDAK